jgi:hypothetical protein
VSEARAIDIVCLNFFNILFVVIGWYSVMFLGDAWLKSHLSYLLS